MLRAAVGLLAGFFLPLLVLGVTSLILGRAVTRAGRLRLEWTGPLERNAVSTAVGLALMSHLLLFLGLAGLLRAVPLLLLAAAIHVLGFPAWRELLGELAARRLRAVMAIGISIGLVPLLLLALYPPTAFDATLYHLPFAKAFVESGGVPFLPDRRVPVFPQANEILFAAVMLFGRDVAAHGVQLLATLITAALLVAWGRTTWPSWPPAGWLAAAVFLGSPIVVHLAGTGYIEPGLTLFVTASLYALDRWRETGAKGWLGLAALFGAIAADVKYLGLFFLGVSGLLVLLAGQRSRPATARLRDAALFGAVAAVFVAPWYARIVVYTGNPLFPFLSGIFGSSPWSSGAWGGLEEPLAARLARWIRIPWDVVFARDRYNQQPPFSPVYLAAIPLLAFAAVRDPGVRRLLLIAGLYSLVFLWLPADSRYLVPILPLASLGVAGSVAIVVERWPRLAARGLAAALCLACFLPGWLYAGYRVARQGPPPVTPEQRETYLIQKLPVYPAIAFLNRQRGSGYTVWAFHAENMAYFAEGRFLGDFFGPAGFDRVLAAGHDAASLHRELHRLGATHLLIPTRGAVGQAVAPPLPDDAAFRAWFEPLYEDPGARLYALRPHPNPSPKGEGL